MILGQHYQNAYVTRDIHQAMDRFRKEADVRAESYYEGEVQVRTRDGLATMHNKIAFMWVGDLQYELIEPVSGLEHIYAEALPGDNGVAFHHACMRVGAWAALKRLVEGRSLPVAFEGEAGPLQFLYVDARPWCGHFLEYTCMPDEMWTASGGRLPLLTL